MARLPTLTQALTELGTIRPALSVTITALRNHVQEAAFFDTLHPSGLTLPLTVGFTPSARRRKARFSVEVGYNHHCSHAVWHNIALCNVATEVMVESVLEELAEQLVEQLCYE